MNIRTLFALAGVVLAGSAIGSGEGPVLEETHHECMNQCRSAATFSTSEPVAGGERHMAISHDVTHGAPAVRCVDCHGGRWLDWNAPGVQGGAAKK